MRSTKPVLTKEKVKCRVCRQLFIPDKRHPKQKVCFETECRRKARVIALRKWRERFPDYFKNRADNIESMRAWRKAHPEYYQKYRKAHPQLKVKSREYVRNHRQRRSASFTNAAL
jgi:hypothetical protein